MQKIKNDLDLNKFHCKCQMTEKVVLDLIVFVHAKVLEFNRKSVI